MRDNFKEAENKETGDLNKLELGFGNHLLIMDEHVVCSRDFLSMGQSPEQTKCTEIIYEHSVEREENVQITTKICKK
jgi:hypothetical protein